MEQIPIKNAIRKGLWILNGGVTVIILGYIFIALSFSNNHPLVSLSIVAVGFVLSWTYWSFAVSRWKLWAYARVDNLIRAEESRR